MFSRTEFCKETLFNKFGRTGVVLLFKSLFSRGEPPLTETFEVLRAYDANGSTADLPPIAVPDNIPSI